MKHAVLAACLLLAGCAADVSSLRAGLASYQQNRVADAEAIFTEVAADPAAPAADRAAAWRELARIAWLVDDEAEKALTMLDQAITTGEESCEAFFLRNRVLLDRQRFEDVMNARDAACTQPGRSGALQLQRADAALSRHAVDGSGLEAAATLIAAADEDARQSLEGAELRLELALAQGSGTDALQAWRDYFWLSDRDAPQALVSGDLPVADIFLSGAPLDAAPAPQLALADLMMRAGFSRVLERFVKTRKSSWPSGDATRLRVQAYLEERKGLETLLLASNRKVARGGRADDLEGAVQRMNKALAAAAGEAGDPAAVVRKAYGLHGTVGETSGFASVHLGHVIEDERHAIEQYGHNADVGLLSLDHMLSNGYESWLWDGSAEAGGWAEAGPVIVQVRTAYASGPLTAWRLATDERTRKELRDRQPEKSAADLAALGKRKVAYLPGLSDRLRLQVADQVLARARATSAGGDLRRAFLEEYWRASFQQSIFVHEGRHALDKTLVTGLARLDDANLEYRAKLSELGLADYPTLALYNINAETIGGDTPHGKANASVLQGYVAWIEGHPTAVTGYDKAIPALMQIDRLTEGQIRNVAKTLDPIAR